MQQKTEFNFLLAWQKQQALASGKRISQTSTLMMVALVTGFLFILGGASAPWLWEYHLTRQLNALNAQIAGMANVETKVQQLTSLQTQKKKEEQLEADIKKNTQDPGPVLDQLSKLLPTGTKVNAFSMPGDNTFNVNVTVLTPVDVARLWSSLRDSGLFENVDIKTVSLEDKEQQLALTLKLKPGKESINGTK